MGRDKQGKVASLCLLPPSVSGEGVGGRRRAPRVRGRGIPGAGAPLGAGKSSIAVSECQSGAGC